MKSTITLLTTLLLFCCYAAVAQTGEVNCNNVINSINKCGLNLINETYTNIGLRTKVSYGNHNANGHYNDVSYLDDSACDKTNECSTLDTSLFYDVYYPVITNQEVLRSCGLPAVILFHGGSFTDCDNFPSPQIDSVCRNFAKRGFVTFNVQYRRGVKIDLTDNPNGGPIRLLSAQQLLAIYRGTQDARGAIRSIIKRQQERFDSNLYHIDTNYLFVGGGSAGGVLAMGAVYYNQHMLDTVFRSNGNYNAMKNVLDTIDADLYYASPKSYSYDIRARIKGVFNLWGGLIIPLTRQYNPEDFFRVNLSTYKIPFIGFHGKLDHTFDYDIAPSFYTTTPGYVSESSCPAGTTYQLSQSYSSDPTKRDSAERYQLGSYGFAQRVLKPLGIPSEIYLDGSMGHDIKDADDDFGTGDTTSAQTLLYIVQRIATYCQAIVHGQANNLFTNYKSVFEDCENYRHGCPDGDDDCACCKP